MSNYATKAKEVLFKALLTAENKWVYGDLVEINTKDGGKLSIIVNHSDNGKTIFTPVGIIPETICQYLNRKDMDGEKIFAGDLLNIFFTSSDGEHIHDCVYQATIGDLGDIEFQFLRLIWEDGGHNQYPTSTTLSQEYRTLCTWIKDDSVVLSVPDLYDENQLMGHRWKRNDKSFYFKKIGNIHNEGDI